MDEADYTPTDVSNAANPAAAAKKTHAGLTNLAEMLGYDPNSVVLLSAEEAADRGYTEAPAVVWERLYDWTMALAGGESAVNRELGRYGGTPEVKGLGHNAGFVAEPKNGQVMQFFDGTR